MTLIMTTDRPVYYVLERSDEERRMEVLAPGDYMATSLAVLNAETEHALLGQLDTEAIAFPPLPPMGTPLEAGAIYQHGGRAVIVRQSHNRTEHDPADVPALFMVHREDADATLPWIAGEQVWKGTLRTYEGVTYETVLPHVTQSDYTPDRTPNPWRVWVDPNDGPQPWVQPTGAHDAYVKGALVTHNGFVWQSTIDANVWAPGVYGWVKVT